MCGSVIKERKIKKLNIFIAVLIVVAAIGIVMLAVVSQHDTPEPVVEDGNAYHDAEETNVPLLVDFEPLETTTEEYALLYDACSKYVSEHSSLQINDAASNSAAINVTENTFVDAEEETAEPDDHEPGEYIEHDRAYFKDFLMIRYVSQNGVIQVVGARLTRTEGAESEIELINQTDFNTGHFTAEEAQEEKEKGWSFWPTSEENEECVADNTVSEDVFVTCLSECMVGALTDTVDAEKFNSHFTVEGKAALLRIIQVLAIEADCSGEVVISGAGASDLANNTKDRVYLRCELINGDDVIYLDVLLKLNSDLMVFDIDII